LYGLGLTSARDSADFVIDRNGLVRTFTMRPSFSNSDWYLNSTAAGWVDARMKSAAIPSSRQHEDKFYWFTELPEDHAIYFQFNLVLNQGSEPLAAFADRLSQALEQPQVKRLVIDLRNNTGGDNTLLRPLLIALIRSKLNKRGGIYAITGPTTFSAAQNFVNRLESYAEIILVGAPTGENVNFYGDPAEITLPNSRLEAAMSQLWWQDKDPRDKRIATPPSVAVMDSFADYVNGKDAALERALTMPTPLTLAETLELGVSDGVQATVDRYKEYANDPAHKYLSDGEQRVNTLGYKLLAENRTQDAITIFESNAQMHPASANAFDSLGEAYADAKDAQRALAAYQRSYELNPANENAKRMIAKIKSMQ
jgi:hypothetical protein